MDSIYKRHKHINAEIPLGELKILLAARGVEQCHNRPGKELKAHKGNATDYGRGDNGLSVGLTYAAILPGAVVVAEDGLAALRDTQGKAQHQDVDLGDDPNTRQGNVLTVVGERTVVGQGIVEGDLHQEHGHLI